MNNNKMSRRQFVEATGAAAVVGSTGGVASAATRRERVEGDAVKALDGSATSQSVEPSVSSLGGRLIVGEGGYQTIADAWAAADDGDVVFVHSSYDAQTAGEEFPIVLDYEEKEVTLTGGHRSGSVIDAGDTDENVVEVLGRGQNDYRNSPAVENLKIVGGNVGLRIRAAPYSSYKDLVFWQTKSDGVAVEGYTDDDGAYKGSFGITFRNVVSWNCGGHGFRLDTDARPHSTSFFGCHAAFNHGYGVMLRGFSSRFYGGTIQNNGSYGVDARNGSGQLLSAVYFEGNGTREPSPIDVYATGTAAGLTIDTCYFQGNFARGFDNGLEREYAAIALDGTLNTTVENCTYRNYDSSFILAESTTDLDLHRPSHCALDSTVFFEGLSDERTRSNGTIQERDLRVTEGAYSGDVGIHDGTGDCPWGLCLWNGVDWVSVMDGQTL
ncbi:hypothetical protein HSB1_46330 [Halogranum salarium B-1]|uniref:Right handed beta helix domain-containing protein n=2 Tax=Halogranum rubrum TaxID=553466 RepID=J3ET64_9EURY|nr:hypothetical protein HSB1_46330 [Halogranum salarium B-1]